MNGKDINLLPPEIIRIRQDHKQTGVIILILVLTVITGIFLVAIPYGQIKQLELRKSELQKEIQSDGGMINIQNNMEKDKEKLKEWQKVAAILDSRDYKGLVLNKYIQKLQKGTISIKSITHAENESEIVGEAVNDRALAEFVHFMKESELFEKVFVSTVEASDENSLRKFNIKYIEKKE